MKVKQFFLIAALATTVACHTNAECPKECAKNTEWTENIKCPCTQCPCSTDAECSKNTECTCDAECPCRKNTECADNTDGDFQDCPCEDNGESTTA